jgi:outer membrane autotransporter protein
VTNTGSITTYGKGAHAIVAQSVGGGGGIAGDVNRLHEDFNYGLNVGYGKGGGNGGNGGAVRVDSEGTISTNGDGAFGILVQSVGGGGGVAGNVGGTGLLVGSVGGKGSAGTVTVNHSGNITTLGDMAHGIFAQSGGGAEGEIIRYELRELWPGGPVEEVEVERIDFDGDGSNVDVTLTGHIVAQGQDSFGILAQSRGDTGAGDIAVTINSGGVRGGSGSGAGVKFLDGKDNTLVNRGSISALSGNAIVGGDGNETVDNYGTVIGSVDLGAGSNAFNNQVAATFNSGITANLGIGNTLTNAGTLSPGGRGTPLTTTLTGNFVQSSSGTFEVEVYKDGEHDKLHVNGDSASLDGTLAVTRGRGPYKNGTTYGIIEVTGSQGISGSFSDILLPEPKPLLRFGVNQLPNSVEVEAHVPKSTTVAKNRVEYIMGNYLDRILPTAKGDLAYVLGEIQLLSEPEAFSTAFSSLSPVSYDNYTRGTLFSAQQYAKSLQYRMNNVRSHMRAGSPENQKPLLAYSGSDASLGQLFASGGLSQVQGKSGLWLDAFGQWGDQDEEDGFTGYDYFMRGATLGFDHRLADKVMAGLSLGYSRSDMDLDQNQGSGDVKSLFGSLYGSYFDKNLYIDAILSYGWNWYDNSRFLTIGGILREATSDHDGRLFSGYLGGGYYFDFKPFSVGPYGSLQYIYLDEESFEEKGGGGVSLRVDDRQTDALFSELGVRMVGRFEGKYGYFLPEVSLAWGYDFDIDDHVVRASFAGSPGASFSIDGQDVERNGLIAGAGLTFMHKGGFSTSFRYKGDFRGDYKSNAIMGELRFSF